MTKIKKRNIIAGIIAGALVLILAASMSIGIIAGLFLRDYVIGWGRFETEYFLVERQTQNRIDIVGLTELGRQQRVLVIPQYIDGRRVSIVGRRSVFGGPSGFADHIYSENLEKVFFETSRVNPPALAGRRILEDRSLGFTFPNLTRVVVINWDVTVNFGGGGISRATSSGDLFVSKPAYDLITSHFGGGPANITYYLNYETGRNHGVHWTDDVDYGERIEFIPPNPTRQGYAFGGWYREPEGMTRWKFGTDRLPDEIRCDDGLVVYQETRLYARWVRN